MAARGEADLARLAIPKWIWWIFAVIPVLFIVVGLGLLAEAIIYISDAGSTRGEVVDVSRNYGGDSGVTYTPTIRYRRDDGRTFEAETNVASSGYDYAIGEWVNILYTYDDPTEVRIDSVFSLYGAGLIMIFAGGLFLRMIRWFRRKLGGGAMLERVADALTERMREAARQHGPGAKPGRAPETTDPSIRGHAHEPKPKREPVVRRMR